MQPEAVVVDPEAPGRLVIRPVADPVPDRGEAVVRVRAVSLNRGEVRRSAMAAAGWRPGWDLAGEVERAAADGSGPRVGARVVGLLPEGAWAERVAVPAHAPPELPGKGMLSEAATLPVAGLTALHALAKGGSPLARRCRAATSSRSSGASRRRWASGGSPIWWRPGGSRPTSAWNGRGERSARSRSSCWRGASRARPC